MKHYADILPIQIGSVRRSLNARCSVAKIAGLYGVSVLDMPKKWAMRLSMIKQISNTGYRQIVEPEIEIPNCQLNSNALKMVSISVKR